MVFKVKMAKKETAKGYGTRYGPRVRKKYQEMATKSKGPHKCPYCSYEKVRRVAVGIWNCKKCGSKFTNKAYHVGKMEAIKTEVEEEFSFSEESTSAEQPAKEVAE